MNWNLVMVVVGNIVIALGAWSCATMLLMNGHPVAGGWLIAMPVIFHFDFHSGK